MSEIKVNSIVDASGGSTVQVNGLTPTVSNMAGRNRIINGDMRISQRGTSFTAQGYTLDRWYQLLSGGTATVTQETFPLGSEVAGFSNYLKQVTSVGNDYCGLIYKVEDVKSLAQGTATISFYAKGTNPSAGSFQLVIYRMHDGSTVYDTLLDTTITVTTSWQSFTHSFNVPTLAGMSTPTANSLIYIGIRQSDGDTSTAAWELNLTGVQLEAGSVATPFEHRQYGQELALCQRYYQKITNEASATTYIAQAQVESTSSALAIRNFIVPMRDAPSALEQTGTASDYRLRVGGSNITLSGVPAFNNATSYNATVTCPVISGLTAGQAVSLRPSSTGDVYLAWSAEL